MRSILHPSSFTEASIRARADAMHARDLSNFERCVLALELVGRLKRDGLDFIFKGGTSLILLFDPPRRLSIDVDILSLDSLDRLHEVLDRETVEQPPFTHWEHQEARDREAPSTKHFKVHYGSAVDTSGNQTAVQIDVIAADSPYASLQALPIRASFIDVEEDVTVNVPTPSSLLGDKVAVFAPSTIGYPYQPVTRSGNPGEPRPMKVVKHLFDVGELAAVSENLAETAATYRTVYAEQIEYREGDWSIDDTLSDTQEAAFWVSRIDGNPREENEYTSFFRKGIRALDSHLFNLPFQREQSRLAAARATLTAEVIRRNQTNFELSPFLSAAPVPAELRDAHLTGDWANLNHLKRTDIKAFECWHMAQSLRL